MRKSSALFILIVVFFPLALAAMTLTAIRPWILDRSFYERMVSDERLFDVVLNEELPGRFNQEIVTAGEQLPVAALSAALQDVVTPAYLRDQTLSVIDQAFDYVDGRVRSLDIAWDIAPIKAALVGDGGARFAEALASALPDCAVGEQPIASTGRLTRCIAANGSAAAASEQIAAALPDVLAQTPNQIRLTNRLDLRTNWYDYSWLLGSSIRTTLDVAVVYVVAMAALVGIIVAYLGGDGLRGRLKWLSSSLFAPASLFVLIGLVLTLPMVVNPLSEALVANRWGGAPYSDAMREAVIGAIVPIVQQVGSGFLVTGVVSFTIALGLLIWSWLTPAGEPNSPRIVQVPARNQ